MAAQEEPAGTVSEADDRWTVELVDGLVAQLRIDHAFSLVFGGRALLQIEEPFLLARQGEEPVVVPPGDAAHEVADALPLLHDAATALVIERSGGLEVRFRSGAVIGVAVNDRYESWNLDVPGLAAWVGLPGGGVARFGAAGRIDTGMIDSPGRRVLRRTEGEAFLREIAGHEVSLPRGFVVSEAPSTCPVCGSDQVRWGIDAGRPKVQIHPLVWHPEAWMADSYLCDHCHAGWVQPNGPGPVRWVRPWWTDPASDGAVGPTHS